MPEVRLTLAWPDGQTSELYSPSTVILTYLRPGEQVAVEELRRKGREALQEASERVRARYGFACTRTDEEQRKLENTASTYDPASLVTIGSAS
ncbi:MAG: MSMEG_0570 family nitrogen starvation response protein [Synechococcus sp.]